MNITKADLVNQISTETGVSPEMTKAVIISFMKKVPENLKKGDNVFLRGFGSFIVVHRAQKTARNIGKNTLITIPARDEFKFKPVPGLKFFGK
jgi:DNA-binding protein HU-beta